MTKKLMFTILVLSATLDCRAEFTDLKSFERQNIYFVGHDFDPLRFDKRMGVFENRTFEEIKEDPRVLVLDTNGFEYVADDPYTIRLKLLDRKTTAAQKELSARTLFAEMRFPGTLEEFRRQPIEFYDPRPETRRASIKSKDFLIIEIRFESHALARAFMSRLDAPRESTFQKRSKVDAYRAEVFRLPWSTAQLDQRYPGGPLAFTSDSIEAFSSKTNPRWVVDVLENDLKGQLDAQTAVPPWRAYLTNLCGRLLETIRR